MAVAAKATPSLSPDCWHLSGRLLRLFCYCPRAFSSLGFANGPCPCPSKYGKPLPVQRDEFAE